MAKKVRYRERQRVVDRTINVDLDTIFDRCGIADVVESILAMRPQIQYGAGEIEKFRVDADYDSFSVYMDVYRDETDAEMDKRIAKEEQFLQRQAAARERQREAARKKQMKTEDDERAEYERLRAKFGSQ
jgi:transcription elongation factor Elf1